MATLSLVRHGQATFGASNNDQLSDLGQRQSLQLGRYFASKDMRFDAVLLGTSRRDTETLHAISQGMGAHLTGTRYASLNDYNSRAVIQAVHTEPLAHAESPQQLLQQTRLLRQGLTQWMLGQTQPTGMPSWATLQQQVRDLLTHVQHHTAQHVLLLSSSGPIASVLGHVLSTPPDATVELIMRLRHTAVSEVVFTPERLALQTYNSVAHLEGRAFNGWISYV